MNPLVLIVVLAVLGGCAPSDQLIPRTGGDPVAGKATIRRYGCNACHEIPGVRGFGGMVGPPLGDLAGRAFIAGELPNTPVNLVRWIQDPRGVEAHTAMPTLGLTKAEARDVAAYLYTLD